MASRDEGKKPNPLRCVTKGIAVDRPNLFWLADVAYVAITTAIIYFAVMLGA
jgi:hypothetical protein